MYQRILVGTDGSSTAAKAVDRAAEMAKVFGSELTVLTAGKGSRAQSIVQGEAQRLAARGVTVETRVVDDDPASALANEAERGGFDLLVMGNKGMVGARRLLGSVPNKVTNRLPCNTLIVHTT